MELKNNDDKILIGKDDSSGQENYAVCLKMIFHDLADLNNVEVDNIFTYYKVGIASNGRVSITLPRLKN